jgi:heptosyltransferase-2
MSALGQTVNGQLPRDRIRRILIIKWSALGDVAIASALMEDVARAFPAADIDLNTQPGCLKLFRDDPRFRQVFAIDVRKKGQRGSNALAWVSRVRAGRYDLLIDLQRSDRSRLLLTLLWLTGGAPRYRLGNRGGFPYTHQPENRDPQAHAFVMMRSVLESVGIPVRTSHPVFYPSAPQMDQVKALRTQHGLHDGRYVVLLPGSHAAGLLKRWGTERYFELARLLHAQGMEKIVLIGGPDEVEVCEQIAAAGDFVVDLNKLELLQIAPLCEGAAAIIGNDTGNAHFAAGAGRPLLVLCGPTDPRRVKPIGDSVFAVQANLPCISCYSKQCRNPDYHACMKAISAEWVAASVPALIAGNFRPGQAGSKDLRSF